MEISEEEYTLVVALNEENYPTWKPQCKTALVREGLCQKQRCVYTQTEADKCDQKKPSSSH